MIFTVAFAFVKRTRISDRLNVERLVAHRYNRSRAWVRSERQVGEFHESGGSPEIAHLP